MSNLILQWTITPEHPPQPRLACNRCGKVTPYVSSGKIRLNANGKRLDAWLIYNCVVCRNSWNRPVFERRHISDIDPALLGALQTNDACWATGFAFDLVDLRRFTQQIEESGSFKLRKEVVHAGSKPWRSIELILHAPLITGLRLDRLLATGLQMSRAHLDVLVTAGIISVLPAHRQAFRRPVQNSQRVTLDLFRVESCEKICHAALDRTDA